MNFHILHTRVQEYISNYLHTDISALLFKKQLFEQVDNRELAEQIESKIRAEHKLPGWVNTPNIYYPNKLNIEQTSSEVTAAYKAGLVSGETLIDITGGFGVDAFFFSKQFKQVIHCEINTELSSITAHNAPLLGADNISFFNEDGIEFLQRTDEVYDYIYIDPSRRNDSKGKVFMLADCLPDVPFNLDMLFEKTDTILIKTSPMLDVSVGLNELSFVAEIHTVAVHNEVKELLWLLRKEYTGPIFCKAVNLGAGQPDFFYNPDDELTSETYFSEPLTYLYEPNAAILKSGAFKTVGTIYGLKKLHTHSHLYTSDELKEFPGRVFKIDELIPYNKKVLKEKLYQTQANITSRNFPDKPDAFRKQYKIKDGGNVYMFLTTNLKNEKIVLLTHKAQ